MSEYSDEYGDENEGVQGDGPAALRKAQKEAVARAKAAEKELADLKAQFAEVSKAQRATTLKDVLSAAGGPAAAKVAAFYPSDAEVTPDAVKSWLGEHKDVFNLSAPAASDEAAAEKQEVDPAIQSYLEARERMQDLEQERVESPGDEALISQMTEVANNAKTMQELTEGFAKLGGGNVVSNRGYRR